MDELATYERIKNLALNPLSSFLFFFPPTSNKFHKNSILFFFGISREKKRIKIKLGTSTQLGYLIKLAKNWQNFCIKKGLQFPAKGFTGSLKAFYQFQ
jgi:hypothetical protein